ASINSKQGGTWLTVTPNGSVPGVVNVSLIPAAVAALAIGTYNATVTITPAAGGPPIDVPVALTVSAAPPVTASPTTVNLAFQIGGTNNSAQQTVTLSTTG